MKNLHLIISGRVQGVGFRDWLTAEATRLRLSGWVRNLGQTEVEAVIAGPAGAVDECLRLCRQGPPAARVVNFIASEVPASRESGFQRRSSVART